MISKFTPIFEGGVEVLTLNFGKSTYEITRAKWKIALLKLRFSEPDVPYNFFRLINQANFCYRKISTKFHTLERDIRRTFKDFDPQNGTFWSFLEPSGKSGDPRQTLVKPSVMFYKNWHTDSGNLI